MTEPGETPPDSPAFPFRGLVIWLTPEQGGRANGPPPETGLASFVLRGFRPRQWRSQADGRWLVVGDEGDQVVRQGLVVVITEGARDVAFSRRRVDARQILIFGSR